MCNLNSRSMSKKYEVWGYDTFAREDYLCGTYSTRREAQQVMRKMECRVQGQPSSLRDSFSILEVTDEVDEECSLRESELNWQKSADADYDSDFLSRVVDNLLQQLSVTTAKGKRVKVEYECANTDDCFDKIVFTLISFKGMEQALDVEIQFRQGEFYNGGTISKVFYRMPKADFRYWLNSEYAKEIMCVEVEELINSFYLNGQ